ISVTGLLYQERATPAGTATTARKPTSTEATARGLPLTTALLLLVGLAIRGRRRRATDHSSDGDEGEDVRKHVEQRRCRRRVDLQPERNRVREPKEESGRECPGRPPVAEDHGRQRDEPAAVGHVVDERPAAEAVGEVDAAERGEDARQDDGAVAHRVDV